MNRIELSDRIANMWLKSRADSGKSQDYVARALGVSKKTIQNWEAGIASPNLQKALEWFEVLGVPMYPYIMSLLYPDEIDGITEGTDMNELKKALHIYVDELDDLHVRELLYILHGSHGSSPTGSLDIITAYLHLPLMWRVCIAEHILSNYKMAQMIGEIEETNHVMPKEETIQRFIDTAKGAVRNGKGSYTGHND